MKAARVERATRTLQCVIRKISYLIRKFAEIFIFLTRLLLIKYLIKLFTEYDVHFSILFTALVPYKCGNCNLNKDAKVCRVNPGNEYLLLVSILYTNLFDNSPSPSFYTDLILALHIQKAALVMIITPHKYGFFSNYGKSFSSTNV